jgi:hypothetical protein
MGARYAVRPRDSHWTMLFLNEAAALRDKRDAGREVGFDG